MVGGRSFCLSRRKSRAGASAAAEPASEGGAGPRVAHLVDVGVVDVGEVVGDLLDHHRQAAGIAEVLHQELARGLQVQDAGQLGGQAVEVVERELDADAPGDRSRRLCLF